MGKAEDSAVQDGGVVSKVGDLTRICGGSMFIDVKTYW